MYRQLWLNWPLDVQLAPFMRLPSSLKTGSWPQILMAFERLDHKTQFGVPIGGNDLITTEIIAVKVFAK